MNVDERCTVLGCHAKLVAKQLHRLLTEDRVRPGEVRQIGGVHGKRPEAVLLHAGAEGGELFGEFGAARPARWVAGEDLEPHCPNRCGAIGRLDEPRPCGEVGAEHAIESPSRCGWCAALQFRSLGCHGERVPRRAADRSPPYAPFTSASRATATTPMVVHPAARRAPAAASKVAPLVQMSSTRITRGGIATPVFTAKTRSITRRRSARPSACSAGTALVRSRSGAIAHGSARAAAAAIKAA